MTLDSQHRRIKTRSPRTSTLLHPMPRQPIPSPTPQQARTTRPRSFFSSARFIPAILLALLSLACFAPLVLALVRAARWLINQAHSAPSTTSTGLPQDTLTLFATTAAYVVGIALLAALLAIPSAWLLTRAGRRARRLSAIIAVPLFMPSYLAYAGWGLLRAPRTFLGDFLSSGSNAAVELKFLVANHFFAVGGLALWSYPIAAGAMAVSFARIDNSFLDTLTLDRASSPGIIARFAHLGVLARLMLPGFLSAVALVALVMLGSVVPLDVAQVPTFSIHLLRQVTQRESIEAAWASAWPLYILAITIGCLLTSRLRTDVSTYDVDARTITHPGRRSTRLFFLAAAIVWILATLVPLVLFLIHMQSAGPTSGWRRVGELSAAFWRDSRTGILVSTRTALIAASLSVAVCLAAWIVASQLAARSANRTTRLALRIATLAFLLTGLLPGVLIGSAAAQAWTSLTALIGRPPSWIVVSLTHLARFGFIPILLGWWIARQEPAAIRDLRRLDGALTGIPWIRAVFLARWPSLLGVAAACFALSFHEIEATVFVQPPGPQTLSQQLLNSLHFARDEYLAAAVVNLLGFTGLLAIGVAAIVKSPGDAAVQTNGRAR